MKKVSLVFLLLVTFLLVPLKANAASVCDSAQYACAYCEYRLDSENTLKYKIESNGSAIPTPSVLNEWDTIVMGEAAVNIKDNLTYNDFATEEYGYSSLTCPSKIYIYSGLGNVYVYKEAQSSKENGTSFTKAEVSLSNYGINAEHLFGSNPGGSTTPSDPSNPGTTPSAPKVYECKLNVYNQNNLKIDTASVFSNGSQIVGVSFTKAALSIPESDYSKYASFAKDFSDSKCPEAKIDCTDKGRSYTCEMTSTISASDLTGNSGSTPGNGFYYADYCAELSSVWTIAGYVIFAIKVFVPVILIIMSMIELVKAITAEKDIKPFDVIKNKVIAALAVFLVAQIFTILINVIGSDTSWEACAKCTAHPFDSSCVLKQVDQVHDGAK